MPNSNTASIQDNLLSQLKNSGLLDDYKLTVYCRNDAGECPPDHMWTHSCALPGSAPCTRSCVANIKNVLDQATPGHNPVVFRCPVGLLGFVSELPRDRSGRCYLVGCGGRERSLDLYRIENISRTEGIDPFVLLEHIQDLPVLSEQAVQDAAAHASRLISAMTYSAAPRVCIQEGERLAIVAALSEALDGVPSADEIFVILGEAIGMMFDVPAIVAILPETEGTGFIARSIWGHSLPDSRVRPELVSRLIPSEAPAAVTIDEESLRELLPHATSSSATCQSLVADGKLLGLLAFLNITCAQDQYLHVQLLTGRAALRLARLQQEDERARKNLLSSRLLSIISALAVTEGQELHNQVLQMGSELVGATTGSLMILDEKKETLQIAAAIGMSPHLLRVLNIKVGSGIAGKVAMTGNPLLVNDIERDERVAAPNRPRFKTKSFLSVPLVHQGLVLGVLNLSDKASNGIFTEADLEVLTPFVRHVSLMMQRSSNEKKVEMLERLSITDPLTELYNRRYLERRMEEEVNRSLRTGQNLTVMLIDLDYFKIYNDVCGHIAGDKALKKAASVLRESVRDMDVVTRYGGEEFCILLPGTSKRESIFVAERIRRDIESELFPGEEHLPFGRLTTSIGVSSFPEDGSTSISVINAADIALYEAKTGGRNRIVIFSSSVQSDSPAHCAKVTQLKK